MKIIKPDAWILTPINGDEVLKHLECCGRVCYKSEDKITEGSDKRFVKNIINRGHEAVIEHFNVSAKFICDRGVANEIVRHRLASYCQESTRYANYSKERFGKEITVIEPVFFKKGTIGYAEWESACQKAEKAYFKLLKLEATPEEARSVLPTSLKTELIMTANLREWRHFFKLRTSKASHPQMREVANILLKEFKEKIPLIFEDIKEKI